MAKFKQTGLRRLTIHEAADLLSVGDGFLRWMLQNDKFPQIGRAFKMSSSKYAQYTYLIYERDVLKFLDSGNPIPFQQEA